MTTPRTLFVCAAACLFAVAGCSAPVPPKPPLSAGPHAETPTREGLRGVRYCEVLIAESSGRRVAIDVYNSIGLGDCPQAEWDKLDEKALRSALGADKVTLNGPRYWTIDRLSGTTKLLDPTPRALGGIPMRLAGRLELTLGEIARAGKPYNVQRVHRTTTWIFSKGKLVYELVAPDGRVFAMQSFSVQRVPQTEASLAELGAALHPPEGWAFRSRMLEADLEVKAVDDVAEIIRDERENTYQRWR